MNPYCIRPGTHFRPPNMAFAAGLRLLRSHPLSFSAVAPPRLLLSRRVSDHRFLSAAIPHQRRRLFAVKASSRRREEEVEENGSAVAVRDAGGSGGEGGDGRIVATELHKEATEAYLSYAMSVLLGRALPDVRDGLKPVHRRILYAMHELGLSSKKPHKKCARVVGEVLGKFHPHGDTAVYDSLVRMAQDFSLRSPLIRGHGNFGSIDADPPAAMRYTECRLEVDFVPNFDNSQKEPSLLPARIPNLLLNGASGIAVGMATNIPPHNLGELVDALSVLIHNPDATLQELLEYMPGPDFPTGGIIMGNIGILEAYRTGRGRVVIRGKTDIELLDVKSKRSAIIIKEIPYQTNKASLVEKIAELVENKSLEGISDIRDESDRSGMRIVIELKRGSDSSIVLNNLFRHTALQTSFSCNIVGRLKPGVFWYLMCGMKAFLKILNGQPKLMGLKELLQAFLDFRCSVVERRAQFKLSQAKDRYHIVEGIITGLDNLDSVIDIIRKASNHAMAATNLRKGKLIFKLLIVITIASFIMEVKMNITEEYNLSDKQADAILDISLRKLTSLEKNKFIDEGKSLSEQISKLQELLSSKKLIYEMIEAEANEIKNKFSTPRRSTLEDTDSGQLEDIDVIPNEEMLLALSEKGYLKRMTPNTFNLQHRGTIGKSVGKLRVNDAMSDFLVCRTHDHVLYFSDKGTVYCARAYKIPECSRAAAGTPLVQVPGDELKWVRRCTNDDYVAMASHNGMVILSPCENFSTEDRLAAVFLVDDGESDEQVVLVSQSGTVNRIKVGDISIQGVILMRLEHAGKIQSASLISAAETESEEVDEAAESA
ncbi:DNA GYRASE A [Perilla frutescens var. hirtella]|nr:DNA GYRASE A [Perilla frutescens var. hirtella]